MSGPIYRMDRHLRSVRRWFAVVREARAAGLAVDRWELQGRRRLRDVYRDEINDMATALRDRTRAHLGECEACLSVLDADRICWRCVRSHLEFHAADDDELRRRGFSDAEIAELRGHAPPPRLLNGWWADDYDPWRDKHMDDPSVRRDSMGGAIR